MEIKTRFNSKGEVDIGDFLKQYALNIIKEHGLEKGKKILDGIIEKELEPFLKIPTFTEEQDIECARRIKEEHDKGNYDYSYGDFRKEIGLE